MKKLLIEAIVAVSLAIASVDSNRLIVGERHAIVFNLGVLPRSPLRRKPMNPRFAARLV